MDRIQYLVDLYIPYLQTIWILCLICSGIFIISLGIYIVSNIKCARFYKISRLLFCNAVYFLVVYWVLWLTLEFTGLESLVISLFILGISSILYCLFYIFHVIARDLINLYKRKKSNKNKKQDNVIVSKETETYEEIEHTTKGISYTITKEVSKFTSNYLKSFIREGKPINRLQIMIDNKEDYITKLQLLFSSHDPNHYIDARKVAEFYYNYYVKKFSE